MTLEETIKSLAYDLGADLCGGIAPVERFRDASWGPTSSGGNRTPGCHAERSEASGP
ncbi:MAG: hypothetical protein KBE65_16440 [Phycisphaerae bacterium]|nr:hypothetical protein [Phycisphaerae bacterium]